MAQQQQQQQLLLGSGGNGISSGSDLVDALPYVDQDYADPQLKYEVEQLIEEEMRRGDKRPGDFLVDLPSAPSSSHLEHCPMVAKALERLRAGKAPIAVDLSRSNVEAPPVGKSNDLYSWNSALENAKTQLGHQSIKFENLDLLLKYGGNAWRQHNQHLEALAARLQANAQDLSREIEGLNRERKLNQQAAAAVLDHLKIQWRELCEKNNDIESACMQLEGQIESLQRQAIQRNIPLL